MPDTIETLGDWNTRLGYCGCCTMPECPTPEVVCESKSASRQACGESAPASYADLDTECPILLQYFHNFEDVQTFTFTSPSGTDTETRTIVYTRDADGFCTWTDDTVHDPIFSGSLGVFISSTVSWSGGVYHRNEVWTNGTYDRLTTYFSPETESSLTAVVRSVLDSMDWTADGSCYSEKVYQNRATGACAGSDPASLPYLVSLTDARFRFRIPSTHTGTYFKIEADQVFYPDGWDTEGGTPPSIVSEHTVEWTGPGTGDADDPSWLTPWIDIAAPSSPGTVEIRNIAFTCYHGPYGTKPQYTGETFVPA